MWTSCRNLTPPERVRGGGVRKGGKEGLQEIARTRRRMEGGVGRREKKKKSRWHKTKNPIDDFGCRKTLSAPIFTQAERSIHPCGQILNPCRAERTETRPEESHSILRGISARRRVRFYPPQ